MFRWRLWWVGWGLWLCAAGAVSAQQVAQVVDIPTRPGVTQRFLYLAPAAPRAAVILIAGGHGGLQMSTAGDVRWGADNFVVRTRELFARAGMAVAVVDAPSDRQTLPHLNGFRQTPEHAKDLKAVMQWLRAKHTVSVWLVGTSMGTLSAAYVGMTLPARDGGPDGVVLTSSVLVAAGAKGLRPVMEMPVQQITMPVLVVHHTQDGCKYCPYDQAVALMDKLSAASAKALISISGGMAKGDPCHEWAYHGFNGMEAETVTRITEWIAAH